MAIALRDAFNLAAQQAAQVLKDVALGVIAVATALQDAFLMPPIAAAVLQAIAFGVVGSPRPWRRSS